MKILNLNIVKWVVPVFALALVLSGVPGHAVDIPNLGFGPGCSAIEGVLATDLTNGDMFIGRINRGQIETDGESHKHRGNFGNSDGDLLSDSLEGCINDALIGYCGTIGGDDNSTYSYVPIDDAECRALGLKVHKNQKCFKVTCDDASACAVSECSDHVDNECDGEADFYGAIGLPADTDCTDYHDDDEGADECG